MATLLALVPKLLGAAPKLATYVAPIGLAGLAVYQLSVGDLTGAYGSAAKALGFFGLGHSVNALAAAVAPPK